MHQATPELNYLDVLIIPKYRAIFVRNLKCGSQSIYIYLKKYIDYLIGLSGKYRAAGINRYPNYFLFGFVRNPYDRFISIYSHSNRYFMRPNRKTIDIHQYAELIRAGAWSQLTHWDRYHARPQVNFFPEYQGKFWYGRRLAYKVPCSFVGRFEHINEDFAVLQEILGMPRRPLPKYTWGSDRVRGNVGYKHYGVYYDAELRRLVEEIYAEDIERFGYSFEEEGSEGGGGSVNITAPQGDACRRKHEQICLDLKSANYWQRLVSLVARIKLWKLMIILWLLKGRLRQFTYKISGWRRALIPDHWSW